MILRAPPTLGGSAHVSLARIGVESPGCPRVPRKSRVYLCSAGEPTLFSSCSVWRLAFLLVYYRIGLSNSSLRPSRKSRLPPSSIETTLAGPDFLLVGPTRTDVLGGYVCNGYIHARRKHV